jgi:Ni,Fe-hydrogenase III large subunit
VPRICLPFGPYHPALGEPEYFQIVTEGEEIVMVDFDLGYNYREMEKKVLSFSWPKAVTFLGRICGICSSAHTQAFTLAVESINQIEVPRRASWIRCFGAELERLTSHLMWLGLMGEMAGFEPLFYLSWGAREHVLNILERFGGRRLHYAYMAYGGVCRDLKRTTAIKKELTQMKAKYKDVREATLSNEVLEQRLKGVGLLSKQTTLEYGVVGPTARGSGVDNDVRKAMPYQGYEDLDFEVPLYRDGDAYARTLIRLDEVEQSIRIVDQILSDLPKGPLSSRQGELLASKTGQAVQTVEAPRGENFHYVSAGKATPSFVRVRPPTFSNLSVIPLMLKGLSISDVPIVINSIDPCFACTDRVVVIDKNQQSIREVEM